MTQRENVVPGRFTASQAVRGWPALEGPWLERLCLEGTRRLEGTRCLEEAQSSLLRCERGTWGKAHGARSDFRWLARSAGFARRHADLGRRLNLGLEDRPRPFAAWRTIGDTAYAVAAYPSRATDAAGRGGFLEKQVLEWRRRDGEPAAAGALVLAAAAAELGDEEWWTRQHEADWSNSDFALPLADSTHELSAEVLGEHLTAGLAELGAYVSEDALTELYAALLGQCHPACLRRDEPLPPRALACLLLPLPRELADRLSLTAWIPSRRYALDDLARRWDVLAGSLRDTAVESRELTWGQARSMACAVLRGDPSELGIGEDAGEPTPPEGEADRGKADRGKAQIYEFPSTSSWHDWTSAMRRNLTRTTDRLIEQDLWPEWRAAARLQPRERLTTALAWLTSEVWSRRDAPRADIDTWNEVLDDIATLKSAHMKRICGNGWHTWPWIPPYEERQLADLAAMAANLGDLARLAETVASDAPATVSREPALRFVLKESRYSGRLPDDALLWLIDPRPSEPPALDEEQWELLRREAGDRLDVALAVRDIPATSGNGLGDASSKKRWLGFGLGFVVLVVVLLGFTLR